MGKHRWLDVAAGFNGPAFCRRYGIHPRNFGVKDGKMFYDDPSLPEPGDLILDPLPRRIQIAKTPGDVSTNEFCGVKFRARYATDAFWVSGEFLYYDDASLPDPLDLVTEGPDEVTPLPTGAFRAVEAGTATPEQAQAALAHLLARLGL